MVAEKGNGAKVRFIIQISVPIFVMVATLVVSHFCIYGPQIKVLNE